MSSTASICKPEYCIAPAYEDFASSILALFIILFKSINIIRRGFGSRRVTPTCLTRSYIINLTSGFPASRNRN
jgi:hypothetical protein